MGHPDVPFSFCGKWHSFSKLMLMVVMLLGKHRHLPTSIDTAVQIPLQSSSNEEIERKLSGVVLLESEEESEAQMANDEENCTEENMEEIKEAEPRQELCAAEQESSKNSCGENTILASYDAIKLEMCGGKLYGTFSTE